MITDSEVFYEDENYREFYTLSTEGEFIYDPIIKDTSKKCIQCGKVTLKDYCSQDCRIQSHRTFRRD